MPMPERSLSSINYRFGFNGKENDNETKGFGNSIDFGARIYDPRIAKWFAIDPLSQKYPSLSPYVFTDLNPIFHIDYDGNGYGIEVYHSSKTILIVANVYVTANDATRAQKAA